MTHSTSRSPLQRALHRGLNQFAAAILLIIFSPVFLFLTVAIMWTMGRPIFFTQARTGRNAKPFNIIKFRSMLLARKDHTSIVGDAERLTGLGKFMRKTSLDELPELINVLKGDMNLVGPRPWLHDQLPHYTPEQLHRFDVRPGITGWAQVNGRNSLSFEERIDKDLWYIQHRSIWLDFKILCKTVYQIFKKEEVEHTYEHMHLVLDEDGKIQQPDIDKSSLDRAA